MSAAAERRALKELAARLRAARTRSGLTQEALAARARIDHRRYQRLEQGEVNPTIRTLVRIASALDTDVWALLATSARN